MKNKRGAKIFSSQMSHSLFIIAGWMRASAQTDTQIFIHNLTTWEKCSAWEKAFDQTLNFFIYFSVTQSTARASNRLFDSLKRLEPFQIHVMLRRLFAFSRHFCWCSEERFRCLNKWTSLMLTWFFFFEKINFLSGKEDGRVDKRKGISVFQYPQQTRRLVAFTLCLDALLHLTSGQVSVHTGFLRTNHVTDR